MIDEPFTYVDFSNCSLTCLTHFINECFLRSPTEMNLCSQSIELLLSATELRCFHTHKHHSSSSHRCRPICDTFPC